MLKGDLVLNAPGQEMPAGQFRAVVAPNALRCSTSRKQTVKNARYARTGKAGIDIERQALARVGVDNAEHADRSAAG